MISYKYLACEMLNLNSTLQISHTNQSFSEINPFLHVFEVAPRSSEGKKELDGTTFCFPSMDLTAKTSDLQSCHFPPQLWVSTLFLLPKILHRSQESQWIKNCDFGDFAITLIVKLSTLQHAGSFYWIILLFFFFLRIMLVSVQRTQFTLY